MSTPETHDNSKPPLADAIGSACPSCCSTNTVREREDSVLGWIVRCNDCGWTWCPSAMEEAKIMADVLYGWAMPNKD